MKKLISVIAVFVIGVTAFAQVNMFEGTLDEAIAKAKKENKQVLVLGSATWCSPCKALEKNVYPTKETGNLINSKTVFIKYNLDKADPDNVANRFAIRAYPTFVVLNDEGVEVNRFVGGARDAAGFNARVEDALKPENSLQARAERFKNDMSTGGEYAAYLQGIYKGEEAKEVISTMFKSRTLDENFEAKNLEAYKPFITDVENEIFVFMTNKKNAKKVRKIMGKEAYAKFLQDKGSEFIINIIFARNGVDIGKLDNVLNIIDDIDAMNSDFAEFVKEYKSAIANRSTSLFEPLKTKVNEATPEMVDIYAQMAGSLLTRENVAQYKGKVVDIYTIAKGKTQNERSKGMYEYYIQQLSQ